MKYLLFSLITIAPVINFAQVHTINNYDDGTRITYYIGECGNDIPEADGKIHFCDAVGNQAVVQNSFGLNSNFVQRMEENFFNDDQLFITSGGLSIKKEDGSWDNLPNRAAPNHFGDPGQNNKVIREAIYLPDGSIIFIGTGIGQQIDVYYPVTKELSAIPLDTVDGNSYPWAIEYDADRDVVWILGGAFTNKKLYKMEGDIITMESDIALVTTGSGYQQDICAYANDNLYFISNVGMTRIDIANSYEEIFYDQSNSGLLPFDAISEIKIDDSGMIWLTQSQNSPSDGGITRLDISDNTYSLYQLENPNTPGANLSFISLGIAPDDKVWVTSYSYGGNISMDISSGDPVWELLSNESFDDLDLPYIYNVDFIHTQNGKTYFCTRSNSTASNDEYEILILEGDQWTGINDNEQGNFSHRMVNQVYDKLLSDPDGGVWWFDQFGDEFLYLKDENEFDFYHSIGYNVSNLCSIESDGDLTMFIDGQLGGFSEGVFTAYEEYNTSQIFDVTTSAGNSVWAFDYAAGTTNALVRFANGEIVESHLLEGLGSYYHMAALSDNRIAFARALAGAGLSVKVFDPLTQELTEFNTDFQGAFREIIAGDNGDFWLISSTGLSYFDDDFSAPLLLDGNNTDMMPGSGNTSLYDAVLDTDMNLHVIKGDGRIYTFSPPYEDLQVGTIQFTGNSGIMPHQNGFQQGYWMIGLDAEGDIWFAKGGEQLYELKDDVSAGEYHVNTLVGIEESYDSFEFLTYPNPTSNGLIHINIPEGIGQADALLLDQRSRIIFRSSVIEGLNALYLGEVSPGLYNLHVISEVGLASQKVMIE